MPRIAEIVGTWNAPRSFISRAPSAESIEPCSIESTPARTARMMPSGPIACAPTTRPHECASSTAASSSSCVNAVKSWLMPGVSTPPVATSLIARRAGADLLAHGAPERVGAVDLAREPDAVAVAARDRERVAGREDPRARR